LRLGGPEGGVCGQCQARLSMAVGGQGGNERGSGLSTARSALGGRAGGEAGRPGPIAPATAKEGWWLGSTADARKRRLRDGRGPLHARANRKGCRARPGVAAWAALPAGEAGGQRNLAGGTADVSLPTDHEERLPAPPRFVALGGGHQLGGAGLDAGFAGRARTGQARRTTDAPGASAERCAEHRFRATDQAAPGGLVWRLSQW